MKTIPFTIPPQPDDETCGISCLLGVYRYYGLDETFPKLLDEVKMLESGGTLSVNLGIHALQRNMKVTLSSYNLQIFDPTWNNLPLPSLLDKLKKQLDVKNLDTKLVQASLAFIEYLELGGNIQFGDFSLASLRSFIDRSVPIIVGLSSTFLYQCKREIPATTISDDIAGYPAGHFVVLSGYSKDGKKFLVNDPYKNHPFTSGAHSYHVDRDHLLTSIFLGILTYDANFLMIEPKHT